ncbi:uncharacterized protein LOC111617711 [Centruroides sculpturatus]|uniref:uncharacterized protein LOC111617711 n=1 Tax=Centruroides sculpturatus TaxID=218467 RepID=UPI000C6D25A3|nr:uncharacterized protein LOC111617711 [Centruroides sculpturatus]XP_023214769.1 uncharacterized protein LOC111617711 [Centruroides sculpturatus]
MILDMATDNNLSVLKIYFGQKHYTWYFIINITEWTALLMFSILLYVALEIDNHILMIPWMIWIWIIMIKTAAATTIAMALASLLPVFIIMVLSLSTFIFCYTGIYFFTCVYNHYTILKMRKVLVTPEQRSNIICVAKPEEDLDRSDNIQIPNKLTSITNDVPPEEEPDIPVFRFTEKEY